jgi:hypothetical protein
MPTLEAHFQHIRPVRHRVTVLETDQDVSHFSRTTDNYPDANGMYWRDLKGNAHDLIPLIDSYFVEELDEDGESTGTFDVLTAEEFRHKFTEHREPPIEYGIQRLARPDEVAPHLSIERCREVMDNLPALKISGEYGIVTRQGPSAPGPWEPLKVDR